MGARFSSALLALPDFGVFTPNMIGFNGERGKAELCLVAVLADARVSLRKLMMVATWGFSDGLELYGLRRVNWALAWAINWIEALQFDPNR